MELYIIINLLLSSESTGVSEAVSYSGLIFYEQKGMEDIAVFVAAKHLNTLLQVNTYTMMAYNILIVYLVCHRCQRFQ